MRNFRNATFSLSKVCGGRLDALEITQAFNNYYYIDHRTIDQLMISQHILTNYRASMEISVTGDNIHAGPGAVVINRSTLQQALVTTRGTVGSETADALEQIADFINRSGNGDAAEIFNEFSSQLQQAEPKKSLLRSLWNGILGTLPEISILADATAKIAAMIH